MRGWSSRSCLINNVNENFHKLGKRLKEKKTFSVKAIELIFFKEAFLNVGQLIIAKVHSDVDREINRVDQGY